MSRDDPGRGDAQAMAFESRRISGLASDLVLGASQLTAIAGIADSNAHAYDTYRVAVSDIRSRSEVVMLRAEQLSSEIAYTKARVSRADADVGAARTAGDEISAAQLHAKASAARRGLESLREEAELCRRQLDELRLDRHQADTEVSPRWRRPCCRACADMALLQMLSALSLEALKQRLADHPEELRRLESGSFAPEAVAAWWLSLNPGKPPDTLSRRQRALIEVMPAVLGNLDGVTYTARDKANRLVLQDMVDTGSTADRAAARAVLDALEVGPNDPIHQLISYRPGHPPLAAVSIGNLDTAAFVNFTVPGMGTRLERDAVAWAEQAQSLYWQESKIAQGEHLVGGIATVAWLGYAAPPIPVQQALDVGVLEGEYARRGASNLARDLSGLLTLRAALGTDPFLSVMGHSYGSTVAANALVDVPVDSFTILGSAGIEPGIARDELRVPDGQFFVAQADERVPWAQIGRDGSGRRNPEELDGVEVWHPVDALIDGEVYEGTDVHETDLDGGWGYLEWGTTSLYNTALAGLDLGDQIVPREPARPTSTGRHCRGRTPRSSSSRWR